jgi:hypothetical protein
VSPAAVAALARLTESARSSEPLVGVLTADLRAVLGVLYDLDEERRILLALLVRR